MDSPAHSHRASNLPFIADNRVKTRAFTVGATTSASTPQCSARATDDDCVGAKRQSPMQSTADTRDWSPYVSLDIPELDADHARLLSRVNALLAAVASRDPAVVDSALRELRIETEAHFAREETLMREARYPGLEQHRAKHQRLLRELSTLRLTLDVSGTLRVPLAPVNYIRRWFAAHITRDDRQLAAYLDVDEHRFLLGLA